jgi:acyl-coenzyme A synthetase/AMP-(fatty) acid ligase
MANVRDMRGSQAEWTWRHPSDDSRTIAFDLRDRPILDILEAAAGRAPGTPALVGCTQTLSFSEICDIAKRVASLIDAYLPPGEPLATALPHSPTGLAALFGCLATGRICCVLNAEDPSPRLAMMLRSAKPSLVVAGGRGAECAQNAGVPCIALDAALGAPEAPALRRPNTDDFDAPTVVHFTSGSTGLPKGIVLSRRSLLYRAALSQRSLQLASTDAVVATSRASTASGLAFVLATIDVGARFLVADLAAEGATGLMGLVERERATVLIFPPPVFRMLGRLAGAAQTFGAARALRSGAAGLKAEDIANWRTILPAGCGISHTYASTEATIVAEWWLPEDLGSYGTVVPAGYLVPGQEYALIDADGQDVPNGEAGELVLRGPHIALGEWSDGQLVPGRMQPDPRRQGWRVFRTGDVMRIGSEGLLRFVARTDRQIKINGTRVEPAEIEAVLVADPAVSDAAVVARTAPTGDALFAFVAAPSIDPASLRTALLARLRANLTPALWPSNLTVLESLPTLPSGKIDTTALLRLVEKSGS